MKTNELISGENETQKSYSMISCLIMSKSRVHGHRLTDTNLTWNGGLINILDPSFVSKKHGVKEKRYYHY